jgi:type II secretory pathway component PulF
VRDRVAWWTPVYRGVVRGRGLADGLFVAAQALAAGGTLPRALDEASAVPDNAIVRQRFAQWGESVANGAPAADAARAARMPELVCGMVGSGVASSQLTDVVRFLARYYDTRANRVAAALEGAAVPALSMGFGVLVGGIALAIFLPLFHLIDTLAGKGFQ